MSAAGRATLVNNHPVKVIDLIGDVRDGCFSVDGFVHVGFDVKGEWVSDFSLDLAAERIEPLYREYKYPGSLVDRGPFCRVLFRVALWAQIFIPFGEMIDGAEFL